MELITALAEAQKCQETTLNEMKKKLEENQLRMDQIVDERQMLEEQLSQNKKVIKSLEYDKNNLQRDIDELIINSQREIDDLKTLMDKNENEWKKLLNERTKEIDAVELKLLNAEEELKRALINNEQLLKKEIALQKELKKLKYVHNFCKDENAKVKNINVNLEQNMNDLKLDLLKMTNCNDRMVQEINWMRKQIETYKELWENAKLEKLEYQKKNEECMLHCEMNRSLEDDFRQLKVSVVSITKYNKSIMDTVNDLKQSLKKATNVASIQTEMTGNDLSQYEHLDREATLLVVSLREELLAAKDELMKAKHENDEMRMYMCETRRQLDVADEEQRVQRLEHTVHSLANLIDKGDTGGYPSQRYSSMAIMEAINDVKKDLALLKTRSWNRVIRAELETPTRDQGGFPNHLTRQLTPPEGVKGIKFTNSMFQRK